MPDCKLSLLFRGRFMSIGWMRALAVSLSLLIFSLAGAAQAEWRRAESPNFVVYSQGSESALRRYVRDLEIYDFILRLRMGLPTATAGRKHAQVAVKYWPPIGRVDNVYGDRNLFCSCVPVSEDA